MKNKFYIVIAFALVAFTNNIEAQTKIGEVWKCNTVETLVKLKSETNISELSVDMSPKIVNTFFHILRRNDGSGGLTQAQVNNWISVLCNDYFEHQIHINVIGQSNLNNTTFYNGMTDANFSTLINTNTHSNAIDIYLLSPNDTYSRAENIPGISLAVGGSYSGTSVLSHEFGHCLGLYHTHSGRGCNDFVNCSENINGSNCSTCGDLVCDTPADPCLSGNVNENCVYIGDPSFSPDVDNIMSYSPPTCLDELTFGQRERIHYTILNNSIFNNRRYLPYISGNTIVCSSNAYSVTSLPPLSTVVWSLSPHPSTIQLQNNVPANNQCLVSNPYKYPAIMTLTATITTNCGATIVITKTIESDTNTTYQTGSYYQQACTAYNHSLPSQIGSLNGSSVFLYPGCMTEVSLSQMTGRTVSFTSGYPQPLSWYYSSSNSKLYLQLPTQSGPYTFSITGAGACNSKTLVFFAYSGYSLLVSPNPASGETTVSIKESLNEGESLKSGITETGFDYDEELELEVYDNQQNQKLKIGKLKGKSTKIQTNGWKEGVYIIRLKYKNEILQEKLVVTK